MGQAGKSFGLMKQVSSLESQVSDLMAMIVQLEECDTFLVGIIELACEQLQCEFLEAPWCFLLCSYCFMCFSLLFFRYLLSELQHLKDYVWIPTLFGLICGVAAPSFFYGTVLSMLEKLLMVVDDPQV
jgi:hypothetical protein